MKDLVGSCFTMLADTRRAKLCAFAAGLAALGGVRCDELGVEQCADQGSKG
jgi:hypothetical protein